ncbi:Protein CBG16034 [Caenorhabditis briggsae]|uniref:Protein CBG16034 n=1 Tax=Caenorhabditis briggsae TaxID=6238 RepID=A8XN88_CAEBR|nr:Protein CBG16034 [Caenorhabditis briggsae]CAP34319.2 Protein CBG16034 [Caenorhabditis briggsae]
MPKKSFVIKKLFENVEKMEIDTEKCGDVEDHLGMSWKIRLLRKDQKLKAYLDCLEKIDNPESLISTGGKFKFNGKEQIFFHDFTKIENSKLAILEYWSQNSNYLKNGSAEIEFLVEIDTEKSIGIKIGKEKSRIFDDDVAKEAVCLSEIKTVSDLRSIVPEESSQFDTDPKIPEKNEKNPAENERRLVTVEH